MKRGQAKAGWQGYGTCIWFDGRDREIAVERVKHRATETCSQRGKEKGRERGEMREEGKGENGWQIAGRQGRGTCWKLFSGHI